MRAHLLDMLRGFKSRLSTRPPCGIDGRSSVIWRLRKVVAGFRRHKGLTPCNSADWRQQLNVAEAALSSIRAGVLSLDRVGTVSFVNSIARSLLETNRQSIEIGAPIWRTVDVCSPLGAWLANRLNAPAGSAQYVAHVPEDSGGQRLLIGARPVSGGVDAIEEVVFVLQCCPPFFDLPTSVLQMPDSPIPRISVGTFAHDISNPLSTIKVFVEMLPLKKDRPAFMDRFNRLVPQEIMRMEQMLSELRGVGSVQKPPQF